MQNKFAFFANFAETIRQLPEDRQADAYKAICEYGIYGILPDDILLKSLCLMAQNSIYKNMGGAPVGNQNAKKRKENEEEKQPKTTQNNPETTSKQPTFHETETRNKKQETETETESINFSSDKSSEKLISGEPPFERKYAFEGKIIKLTQVDYDRWQRAYPNLNLWGELMLRDDWLAKQPPDEQKGWFITTSQYFIRQDAKRKAQNAEIEANENEPVQGKKTKKHTIGDWL